MKPALPTATGDKSCKSAVLGEAALGAERAVEPGHGALDAGRGKLEAASDGIRSCAWCRGDLAATARRDAVYCSQSCRQAAHRFGRACVARARAAEPMRFVYADPPYPGLARRYYAGHPDYAGEVDHAELIRGLADGNDGWALSTNARSLAMVLGLCVAQGLEVRVAAWFRGARPTVAAGPLSAWEPVVFAGGRRLPSRDVADDALICHSRPRLTDPARVVGSKPARFCFWVFDLLGARPGDELVDLYPGSGGIARAWSLYDASAVDLGHESRPSTGHESRPSTGHESSRVDERHEAA